MMMIMMMTMVKKKNYDEEQRFNLILGCSISWSMVDFVNHSITRGVKTVVFFTYIH